MASIVKLGKGRQPPIGIDYTDPADPPPRRRKRLRLGAVSQGDAQEFKRRLKGILACRALNQDPAPDLAAWINGLPDLLYDRLANQGLLEPRESSAAVPALGDFLKKYIRQRAAELRPASVKRLEDTAARMRTFFGEATPIDRITPDLARDWWHAMLAEGLAEASVRTSARNAKTIFADAVERELIGRSPFKGLKSSPIAAERDRYVTPEEAKLILDNCPNLEWRVLFGLARLAGLRCPSETHGVTWQDVDWGRNRLRVYAPKTNRVRSVPIVPALAKILSEAFYAAPDRATRIVTLSRNNLHRGLEIILTRAGLEPWDDLMQTLRRSRETQWAMKYPAYAVAQWMGHSVAVSAKHYVQVVDDLYDQAASEATAVERSAESAAADRCNVLKSTAKGETTTPGDDAENAESPVIPGENSIWSPLCPPVMPGSSIRFSSSPWARPCGTSSSRPRSSGPGRSPPRKSWAAR